MRKPAGKLDIDANSLYSFNNAFETVNSYKTGHNSKPYKAQIPVDEE